MADDGRIPVREYRDPAARQLRNRREESDFHRDFRPVQRFHRQPEPAARELEGVRHRRRTNPVRRPVRGRRDVLQPESGGRDRQRIRPGRNGRLRRNRRQSRRRERAAGRGSVGRDHAIRGFPSRSRLHLPGCRTAGRRNRDSPAAPHRKPVRELRVHGGARERQFRRRIQRRTVRHGFRRVSFGTAHARRFRPGVARRLIRAYRQRADLRTDREPARPELRRGLRQQHARIRRLRGRPDRICERVT